MPVTTRSQSRAHKMKETNTNTNISNKIVVNPDETKYFKIKDSFIAKIKKTIKVRKISNSRFRIQNRIA